MKDRADAQLGPMPIARFGVERFISAENKKPREPLPGAGLNISFEATSQLQMGNEWIEFSARFSGKSHKIEVQVTNVLAIYARENGQGMAFPVDPAAIGAAPDVSGENGPRSSELGPEESGAERIENRGAMVSARDARDDDELPPDDDGSKSSGRGHLKVVK